MRKITLGLLACLLVTLVGCVTINVYFPEAAAKKAADQFIDTVLDGAGAPAAAPSHPASTPTPHGGHPTTALLDLLIPAAYADELPDVRVQTAASEAIRARMAQRLRDVLGSLLADGAVGFTRDGLVAMRDPSGVPLDLRARANAAIADENRDREALYREVASASGHPEWAPQIRATFAKGWIERAPAGWYYQDAKGGWQRK